jgi:hypothetical protein
LTQTSTIQVHPTASSSSKPKSSPTGSDSLLVLAHASGRGKYYVAVFRTNGQVTKCYIKHL